MYKRLTMNVVHFFLQRTYVQKQLYNVHTSQILLALASTMLGPHECQSLLHSLATRGSGTESHRTIHTVSKLRSFRLATFRALIAFVWLVRSDFNARLQLLPPPPFGGPGNLGSTSRRGKRSGGRRQVLEDWRYREGGGRQTGWRWQWLTSGQEDHVLVSTNPIRSYVLLEIEESWGRVGLIVTLIVMNGKKLE